MHFRLLGPVEVWAGQRRLAVGGFQRCALLAALALHANHVVAAEQLVRLLWGSTPPETARNSLHVRLSQLRRLLTSAEPDADAAAAGRLVFRSPGYLLRAAPDELDWQQFQQLADRGRQALAADDAVRARRLLRDALALWRGPALEGLEGPVLTEQRLRLEQRRLTALEDRIEADLRLGCHAELLGELEALVAEQPLRERVRAQLMTALYRAGRQPDALAAYRDGQRLLVEEHGLEPGPELQRLEQAILTRSSALDLPSTPARRPAVMAAPAAPGGGEPAAVLPAQLPADLAEFVGRADVLAGLDGLVPATDARRTAVVIAAVTGTAGVGKTALAVHWAHRVRGHFPGGQLYVDLQGYVPGPPLRRLQALARLLHGLGVAPDRIPADLAAAAGLYRSLLADQRVLVVLDNARDAAQVRPLLPGAPGCLVVITSRDRLAGLTATHGARRLTLDTLTPVESVTLLTRVVGAGRLPADARAARELTALCGHLPLALRIAAANLACHPDWSVADYVARLRAGDQLGGLAVDDDPHATVRVAFDSSYAALPADAQRLFRLLGLVLPGPDFSAPAAAALADLPVADAERLLERLAAGHLLEPRAQGRFGLHDLLRLYARQRAERSDVGPARAAAAARLMDWYLHTADAAVTLLYPEKLRLPVPERDAATAGFDGRADALAWLDAERPNLVAAVQHAEHGPRPATWMLADALHAYFYGRRHMTDWQAVADAALAAAQEEGDAQARAATRRSLGMARHLCVGDYARAAECFGSALDLARQAGWVQGEAAILSDLSMVYAQLGQLQRAADHYTQALELHRRTGRTAGQAIALGNLGNVNRELGRHAEAADQLAQALDLHREIGSQSGQAIALETLGEVHRDLGDLTLARAQLGEALALSRMLGNRHDEAYELRALASVEQHAGRLDAALRLGRAALAQAREIDDRRIEADALNTLGSIDLQLDHPDEAVGHHEQALDLACRTGARHPQIEALLGLAAAHLRRGDHSSAIDRAEQARALACEVGYRMLQGQAAGALAAAHLGRGRHDEAAAHARQALAVHRATGHRLGEARVLVTLGRSIERSRGADAAVACWQRAHALLTAIGSPEQVQVRDLLRRASATPDDTPPDPD